MRWFTCLLKGHDVREGYPNFCYRCEKVAVFYPDRSGYVGHKGQGYFLWEKPRNPVEIPEARVVIPPSEGGM